MKSRIGQDLWLGMFLLAELGLYYLVLTAGGKVLVASSFGAIVLCFLFALSQTGKGNRLVVAGLGCTVLADFCLVICDPIQRLWGMVFFLGTQILYAAKLHRVKKNKRLLILRCLLTVAAAGMAVLVLGEKTDPLALISLCYYANLAVNILAAFGSFRKNRLLAVGLVLFLLCDTVVGLQVASDLYLPIAEGMLLHRILFSGFNLAWFFYLPSQVLIALSCRFGKRTTA